jgi:hypothetical protein
MSVISREERELALQLWTKHKDALRSLVRALQEQPDAGDVVDGLLEDDSGGGPVLRLTVNGQPISGDTVPDFLEDYLTKLDQLGVLANAEKAQLIPYATSPKRYFLARKPIHPLGNEFIRSVEVSGWYAEANRNLVSALRVCRDFGEAAGCKVTSD